MAAPENLDTCFCAIFNRYYQSFSLWRESAFTPFWDCRIIFRISKIISFKSFGNRSNVICARFEVLIYWYCDRKYFQDLLKNLPLLSTSLVMIKFMKIAQILYKKGSSIEKSFTNQTWRLSNATFWAVANMPNNVYRKRLNLDNT